MYQRRNQQAVSLKHFTKKIYLGIRPEKTPTPFSQVANDYLDQTELIFQDVRKNAMKA